MTLPRTSGVLLHPTSLPGPHGSGDLGAGAYHFVDWLSSAQQKIWQILPLGGIGPGNSPYMSSSAFAGNVLLIDLQELQQHGWLEPKDLQPDTRFQATRVDFSAVVPWRMQRLRRAAHAFAQSAQSNASADHSAITAFTAFCTLHASWLDDYALFMALNEQFGGRDWSDWPSDLAHRKPQALLQARGEHATQIEFWQFCQWCFFRQWHRLKQYANAKGIQIVGDVPIFISYQSADVWARPELFELDSDARVTVVAGVPPDYFSTTGQRWGNPLYRWSAHATENYAWWVERIRHTFELVDKVRIDHFRGFAAYWEILASEPTAVMGRWKPGPGAALFEAIHAALGHLPIIAEDLGVITPDVDALRLQFSLPGMRVLQFAFGTGQSDDNANAYLPHNFDANTVVYTGTHDNDTTRGWWADLPEATQNHVQDYLGYKVSENTPIHWALIRLACASVAHMAIYPMQDVLGLGAEHRMNRPGQDAGYWEWRFQWKQVAPIHAQTLAHLCQLYRRI